MKVEILSRAEVREMIKEEVRRAAAERIGEFLERFEKLANAAEAAVAVRKPADAVGDEVLLADLPLEPYEQKVLAAAGLRTVGGLCACTESGLLGRRGFGKVRLRRLKLVLAAYGRCLGDRVGEGVTPGKGGAR